MRKSKKSVAVNTATAAASNPASTETSESAPSGASDLAADLLRGAEAICAFVGDDNVRATYRHLEHAHYPARKIGAQWIASKKRLRRHFQGDAAIEQRREGEVR